MKLNYLYSLVLSSTGRGISISSSSSFSLKLFDGKFFTLELKLLAMYAKLSFLHLETLEFDSAVLVLLKLGMFTLSTRDAPNRRNLASAQSWAVCALVVLMNQ